MSITRRQFLLSTVGAVGGFILPSFYTRALEFLDQFGEPLLERPKLIVDELIICSDREGELNLGDPWEQPPRMSWREFLTRYRPEELDNVEDHWDITESQLDDEAESDYVIDFWCRADSPNARAYRLLESLDLGPALTGPKAVTAVYVTVIFHNHTVPTNGISRPIKGCSFGRRHATDNLSENKDR